MQGAGEGRLPTWGLTPAAQQRRLDPGAIKPVHRERGGAAAAPASVQTPSSPRVTPGHPQHLLPAALRSCPNSRRPGTPARSVALSALRAPGRRLTDPLTRPGLLEGRSPTSPGPPKDEGAFMRLPHSSPRSSHRPGAPRAAPQPQQGTQLWKFRGAPRGGRVRTPAPAWSPPAPPRLGEAGEPVIASGM